MYSTSIRRYISDNWRSDPSCVFYRATLSCRGKLSTLASFFVHCGCLTLLNPSVAIFSEEYPYHGYELRYTHTNISLVCIDFESWFNTMNLDSLFCIPIHSYESLPKVIETNHFFWSTLYNQPFCFSHLIYELHLGIFWCSHIICQLIILKCHLFLLTNSFGNVSYEFMIRFRK